MAADEYIVWVETTAWIPMVVKAESPAAARRAVVDSHEGGELREVGRQLDGHIKYDGPDLDEADGWTVVRHDDYFAPVGA